MKFVAKAVSLAFACLLGGAASQAQPATPAAPTAVNPWWDHFLDGAQLVPLPDGRKIELYCEGHGAPAVILDAGLGDGPASWRSVQDAVAAKTRVCVFSRAGIGRSTPTGGRRDTAAIVDDTEAMLKAARIPGPYILVGHSMASFDARLFAFRHPRQVAGLVLVDPSADGQADVFEKMAPRLKALQDAFYAGYEVCEVKPRPAAALKKCVEPAPAGASARAQAYLAAMREPAFYTAQKAELVGLQTQDTQELVAARRSLGATPLIVLTAGEMQMPGAAPDETAAIYQWWMHAHDEIATLSSAGVNRRVEGTTHYIHDTKPEVVIGAIAEVLDKARAARR
ncbi:MAG: alpha/beta hydrolase fold protein [Phenylobacterium sp.]|nr:alpha/beta hydrolase fold protein [Phenylobacterium sp.]